MNFIALMQKIILVFLIITAHFLAVAQTKPQYSQYMMNSYLINPAVSGIEDYTDIKTGYRNQWTDFEGAPLTYYVSAHLAIGKTDITSTGARPNFSKSIRRPMALSNNFNGSAKVPAHHGIGFILVADKTGANTQNSLNLSYALHVPVTNKIKLSVGFSGGISQYGVDFSKVQVKDNPDQVIVAGSKLTAIQPNLNVGTWLYSKTFFVGISANQFIFNSFNYKNKDNNTQSWIGNAVPHYFLTAGFRQEISDAWTIIPSTLIKRVAQAPLSFDVNVKAVFRDRFWFGTSYRHKDAFVGLLGVNISSLINLGYSYDFTLSGLKERSRGSHEVVIGVMLNNRRRVLCPQNLW